MFEDIYEQEEKTLKTCGDCWRLFDLPVDSITDNRYCPVHNFYVRENASPCLDGIFK